jgi:hypothetical protein
MDAVKILQGPFLVEERRPPKKTDGEIHSYTWMQTSGDRVELTGTTNQTTFVAPEQPVTITVAARSIPRWKTVWNDFVLRWLV